MEVSLQDTFIREKIRCRTAMLGAVYYFVSVCQGIVEILGFLILLLASAWGLYFLCRARGLHKKIHYLKKQTDEACGEELTNARVDFTKSVFIAAICIAEVLEFVFTLIVLFHHYLFRGNSKEGNCTGLDAIDSLHHQRLYRLYATLCITWMLIHISLIHILTSYLSNAYAETRAVRLTRREKKLFLLLFTQLAVLWLSALYWRAFLCVVLFLPVSFFPTHLFFFNRYSRRLYTSLKRRALDAWYEDTQLHNRLKGMCKDYKQGSVLCAVYIILFGLTVSLELSSVLVTMLFMNKCRLDHILNIDPNVKWLNGFYHQNERVFSVLRNIYCILFNILAVAAFAFILLLHVNILSQALRRMVQRRRAYKRYTGTRYTDMHRPLIGSN